jgi:hypothetical protein
LKLDARKKNGEQAALVDHQITCYEASLSTTGSIKFRQADGITSNPTRVSQKSIGLREHHVLSIETSAKRSCGTRNQKKAFRTPVEVKPGGTLSENLQSNCRPSI